MENFDFNWLGYEMRLNKHMRHKISQANKLTQFIYLLYRFLMLCIPVSIVATIYVGCFSKTAIKNDWIIFALLTVIVIISGLVMRKHCLLAICPEYRLREYNVLYFINKKIIYTYEKTVEDQNAIHTYWVALKDVDRIDYNPKTKLITIHGNISKKDTLHKNIPQECSEFSFFDTYNASAFRTIVKYCDNRILINKSAKHIA